MARTAYRKANPDKTRAAQRRYRERTGSVDAPKRYSRWSPREDRQVLAHEIPDRELASKLGRSVNAIGVRRARLNREESPDA